VTPRLLLIPALLAGCITAAPASAETNCVPTSPPPGAATKPIGGMIETLWAADHGMVGITGFGDVQVLSASPLPLAALVIDAQDNGDHQLIISDGRQAHLYVLSECRIKTVADSQGVPFLFDLGNRRGNGAGVGCSDLGDGRHLVGLQAVQDGGGWVVHRTEIDLDATTATIGRSDSVTGASAQDPAVTSAMTITCGDSTIDRDGVQQP
jgi:hypothetical protein